MIQKETLEDHHREVVVDIKICPPGDGFKTMKVKNYQKKIVKLKNDVKTSNKFDGLDEEECVIPTVIKIKSDSKKCKNRIKLLKEKPNKIEETESVNFKKALQKLRRHTKLENRFQVLQDNKEEDLNKIIWRSNIIRTERKKIKKCHKCNFKKRTCVLDPASCQASQKFCYFCKKKGHFPSSLCCKARRKKRAKQENNPKVQTNNQSQKRLSKKIINLVKLRIQAIENNTESKQNPQQILDIRKDKTKTSNRK